MSRAQIAVEFLMTYGWALLGIFLVVGVIVYFGVVDPTMFLPEKCELGYRLDCKDFIVSKSAAQVQIVAVNNFNDDLMLINTTIRNSDYAVSCIKAYADPEKPVLIGETKTLTIPCAGLSTIKDKKKIQFDLESWYYLNGTDGNNKIYHFPLYGQIYAKLS